MPAERRARRTRPSPRRAGGAWSRQGGRSAAWRRPGGRTRRRRFAGHGPRRGRCPRRGSRGRWRWCPTSLGARSTSPSRAPKRAARSCRRRASRKWASGSGARARTWREAVPWPASEECASGPVAAQKKKRESTHLLTSRVAQAVVLDPQLALDDIHSRSPVVVQG